MRHINRRFLGGAARFLSLHNDPPADPPGGDPPPGDDKGKGGGAGDPPADPPAEPAYDLKLPDGSTLDAKVTERLSSFAKERKIAPDVAQQALEFVNTEFSSHLDEVLTAHQPGGAAWVEQDKIWRGAALADPALGNGSAATLKVVEEKAKKAAATFFPKTVLDFLESSGMGSNPDLLKGLVAIADAMGEKPPITGALGGEEPEESTASKFYGGKKSTSTT